MDTPSSLLEPASYITFVENACVFIKNDTRNSDFSQHYRYFYLIHNYQMLFLILYEYVFINAIATEPTRITFMEMNNDDQVALATAHDVAQAAGVSQATVSRAFTLGSSISEVTRSNVFRVAKRLNYQPNQIARSLTSGRSNLVGIGIENLRNPFFSETLEAMSLQLAKAGLRLMLFTTNVHDGAESPVQEVLRYRLDALVLVSATFSSNFASQCQAARVPVILYNRTNGDRSISSITGDNVFGARSLAAFLIAGEHRRFAFIAGLADSSTSRARESGFTSYLLEQGIGRPVIESGDFTYAGAAAATRRLLASRERPDAIFCANDHMATAAIEVAQFEFGLDVGRELSIVGFDDIQTASRPCYSLTTFAQRADLMVQATIEIVERLRSGDTDPVHRIVEGELVVRTSARRPSFTPPTKRSTFDKSTDY